MPEPAREQVKSAEPAYLTALQVAELLQVDEKTVLRWSLQDASMPVLRRGRVVRFPRERLLAWLDRQEPRACSRGSLLVSGGLVTERIGRTRSRGGSFCPVDARTVRV